MTHKDEVAGDRLRYLLNEGFRVEIVKNGGIFKLSGLRMIPDGQATSIDVVGDTLGEAIDAAVDIWNNT